MVWNTLFALLPVLVVLDPCSRVGYVWCQTVLEVGPQSRIVVEGERTSLQCDFNDDNTKPILWTFSTEAGRRNYLTYDDYIYPRTDRSADNYQILINSSLQTYELILKDPRIAIDMGTYECGIEVGSNRKYTVLGSANLTILPISDSVSCSINPLPPLGTIDNGEAEVVCSWSYMEAGEAKFVDSNGQVIGPNLRFSDRIISRVSNLSGTDIICSVTLEISSPTKFETACQSQPELVVRVDPFISQVTSGSNARFVCSTSNQLSDAQTSWNLRNSEGLPLAFGNRFLETDGAMTIANVTAIDEMMLIECEGPSASQNDAMRSYAAIRIVEPTTLVPRRPPGESQTNNSMELTSTDPNDLRVTQPNVKSTTSITSLVIAMILIILVIVILIVVIMVMVKRRQRRGVETKHTHMSMESKDIPHTIANSSSQLYAVSFKDKKTKRYHSTDIDAAEKYKIKHDGHLSSSCGQLTLPISASDDQIYAEPDVVAGLDTQIEPVSSTRMAKCASMPFLDVNEYEVMSVPSDTKMKSKTLSALSANSSLSGRRWTSQRMKKDGLSTPPRPRHALSFHKSSAKSPKMPSEYTQMTITGGSSLTDSQKDRLNKTPLYAKSEKQKSKPKSFSSDTNNLSTQRITPTKNEEYAVVGDVVQEHPKAGEQDIIDTYLSSLPGPFASSFPNRLKNKSTSLQRSSSTNNVPPKPPRGKCQSEFFQNAAYSTISEYEVMSEQIKEATHDPNEGDYADCDDLEQTEHNFSNYDQPRPKSVKSAHTLPRINDGPPIRLDVDGFSETGVQRHKSLDSTGYELIGQVACATTAPPQSPHYADIGDATYASVDDK